MIDSLWGDEFSVKEDDISSILNKIKSPKKVLKKEYTDEQILKSKKFSLDEKMRIIENNVYRILGKYKDDTIVITEERDLEDYISFSIKNDIIAVDTETNNTLDTINCKLMGLCLYTPGQKNAYIPVNHIDINTNEKLSNQITEDFIRRQLQRLIDNDTKNIFHNASFDIKVIKSTCGVKLKAFWDTAIGARVLNENELVSLKAQYKLHIDKNQDKYNIEHLFNGLPYEIFNPKLFALYAATDSYMTYRLYEYQREQFKLEDNKDIYKLFTDIEIPIIDVVTDMELEGIEIDIDYAKKMSVIYHKKSDEIQSKIDEELLNIKPLIDKWRLTFEANAKSGNKKSKNEQLKDPIETSSPTQMAILLYDILKVGVVDNKNPRGTGADILEKLAPKIKLCQLILDKRGVDILINTFIDKIPELVNESTGRLHAKFNTYGADTGRFSSSDPNLQNIPSHDKVIRMMFKARDGYSIVGSDYSAQEPRSLASFSHDEEMLKAYDEGKDLYAVIGSAIFNNKYEDNLEFDVNTGALNPEGKARRSTSKMVQLAISYGMSAYTMSQRIGVSIERANKIIDDFYNKFKGVKKFTEESQKMLRECGYVTDLWGRRRRIPDAQLKEFEIEPINKNLTFNPLIGSDEHEDENIKNKINLYLERLKKAKWNKDIKLIIEQAKKEGLLIKDNRGFINRALRQCLNARIQSTAASMTKKAMIDIHNDSQLKDLGFKLLVTVHDEVFGECPRENSSKVAKRLSEIMINAAKDKCVCKFKCDPYEVSRWYEDEASGEVHKDYINLIDEKGSEEAMRIIENKYSMIKKEYVDEMCLNKYKCNCNNDI